MTDSTHTNIDGFVFPSVLLYEYELKDLKPYDVIQLALSKMSPSCAFRRFPRILGTHLLQHQVVEIDTSQFWRCKFFSQDNNALALALETDSRRKGMLPLCEPQKNMPKELCQMLVFVISYMPSKSTDCRFVSILGVLPWSTHRSDDFDESRTLINMSRLFRNLESVDQASVPRYEMLSAPPPLFVLRSRPSGIEVNPPEPMPPSPKAIASFALMWFAAGKAYGNQEAGRKKRMLVLTRRSCRFFGAASPREALFGSREGFQALGTTMAMLQNSQRAASFVSNQICSAFEMLYDSETRELPHARVIHYRHTIAPLINALSNLHTPHHNFVQPISPLNFRVSTLRELITEGFLTENEAEWISGDSDEILYNDICVSYLFGGGDSGVVDSIIYGELRTLPDRAFIKGGTVYVRDEAIMKNYAIAALRLYLDESAGALYDHFDGSLEATIESTLPLTSGFFPKLLGRDRSLDDCSKGTPMFTEMVKQGLIKGSMIASFERRETNEIPLPVSFDAIELLQLYKEPSVRVSTLDPLELELALLTVTHTDSCGHLTIEYDSDKRAGLVQSLKEAVALRQVDSNEVSIDHALVKKASNRRAHSEIDDIEDLVANLHANQALPLCIEQQAQILLSDSGYLNYRDRAPYYKKLVSLGLPELNHEAIKRHMLRTSPQEKIREHLKELKSFPSMADKAHEKAASFVQRSMMKNSSASISHDESLKMTSASAGCYRMAELGLCPYAKQDPTNVEQTLIRAGVDERRAGLIAQKAAEKIESHQATKICALHLHSSMTATESSPWPEPFREDQPAIKRAHDFVHHMARYHLHRREARQIVDSPE